MADAPLTRRTGDCLLWRGPVTKEGWPYAMQGRRRVLLHRLAYEIGVGLIPEGAVIRQRCEVRRCLAPEHLVAATRAEVLAENRAQPHPVEATPLPEMVRRYRALGVRPAEVARALDVPATLIRSLWGL